MKIVNSPEELKLILQKANATIGFVPTMGALHRGHLSLIEKSVSENELSVVSIFVNPTQFLEGEDLDKYPRRFEADEKICSLAGVDIIFYPSVEEIYDNDEIKIEAPNVRGYILEGYVRPGHFNGVLTIVMKLLNIVSPTRAYFGKKDAQQLFLIKQMVKNYYLDVEIVEMETLRDVDGLAMSSRNGYLSKTQRVEALKISKSLNHASKLIMQNIVDVNIITREMFAILSSLSVEYVSVVSYEFKPQKKVVLGESIILVAARVGETRLIDNLWI